MTPDNSVKLRVGDVVRWAYVENRCKNDMSQDEWDALKSNIEEYFV